MTWIGTRTVRTAELMLLTAAFGYAVGRTENLALGIPASLLTGALAVITVWYIVDLFTPIGRRVGRRYKAAQGLAWRTAWFGVALLYSAVATVVAMGTFIAVFRAIVAAANQ